MAVGEKFAFFSIVGDSTSLLIIRVDSGISEIRFLDKCHQILYVEFPNLVDLCLVLVMTHN
jgi:hypothetical protein